MSEKVQKIIIWIMLIVMVAFVVATVIWKG